jgi:hypothetical protein
MADRTSAFRHEATIVASTARVDGQPHQKRRSRTSQDAQLVAQSKILEQQVSTRGHGWAERSDRPEGVTHRL